MEHKLGIIGFGCISLTVHHSTLLRDDIPFTAVAAYDVREECRQSAAELGIRAFDDIEAFFAEGGFDFVLVATSNNHHCRYACMAMEKGFDVMIEKPAAMNSDEILKMMEVSKRTGRFFTVHHNRRFDRDFRIMMKTIDNGYIGKPRMIESRIDLWKRSGCMFNWRGMTDHGGGLLLDWGVHMLDQILWYIRKPVKSVYAKIMTHFSEEVDDYSRIILQFEDGPLVQIEVSNYSPIERHRWNICGDKGAGMIASIDDDTMKVRRIKESEYSDNKAPAYGDCEVYERDQRIFNIKEFEEFTVDAEGVNCDWGSIYKNIANVLDGKEELFVTPEEVLRSMKVIEAARVSSEENRVVYLDI